MVEIAGCLVRPSHGETLGEAGDLPEDIVASRERLTAFTPPHTLEHMRDPVLELVLDLPPLYR